MRKNPTYKEQLYEGVHANVALLAVYLASSAAGFKFVCLGSFLSILLNSFYMWYIWDKAFATEDNDTLNTSMESEDSEDSEDSQGNQDSKENLSLKQKEHGATLPKAMDEEDEIILNKRFREVVEETRKRNEQRLNEKLPRTPTNSSLTELDEYADMPPLISMSECASNYNPVVRNCPACIHHYNNLIPINPVNKNNVYISTVRELITPSRNTILHGMEDVD
jgi:hypothetical protein